MALKKFKLTADAPPSFNGVVGNLGYQNIKQLDSNTIDDRTAEQFIASGYTWVKPISAKELNIIENAANEADKSDTPKN